MRDIRLAAETFQEGPVGELTKTKADTPYDELVRFAPEYDRLYGHSVENGCRSVLAPLTCTSRKTFLHPALVSCRVWASTLSLFPPGDTLAYPYFMGGFWKLALPHLQI